MNEKISNHTIFRPLKTKRTFREISDQIKNLVYSGVFKPGDRLPSEREMAKQFSAGRMAVREALRVLEDSGFVSIKQGSRGGAFIELIGTKVVKRSISDFIRLGNVTVTELTEARIAIELSVVEYAVKRITEPELEDLKLNILNTLQLGKEGAETTGSNVNFHILLAQSAKNSIFETVLAGILDIYVSFLEQWNVDRKFRVHHVDEHREIYEALRERDIVKLKSRVKDHILSIHKSFNEARDKIT